MHYVLLRTIRNTIRNNTYTVCKRLLQTITEQTIWNKIRLAKALCLIVCVSNPMAFVNVFIGIGQTPGFSSLLFNLFSFLQFCLTIKARLYLKELKRWSVCDKRRGYQKGSEHKQSKKVFKLKYVIERDFFTTA